MDVEVDEDDKSPAVAVSDMGPNLDRLWAYNCPITRERNVSCIAWNKDNAVSMLTFNTNESNEKLVSMFPQTSLDLNQARFNKRLLLKIHGESEIQSCSHKHTFHPGEILLCETPQRNLPIHDIIQ